ncbi:sperm flagellar protein 2-like [Eucyclogobius newberryi]|uniref:sperm flagellar protein 2-like n=1 Tax=Eucyclogobius newberryi TaxID=166745 RepID=UPI003B595A30
MSYKLCKWLNKELRLSLVVEPKTFPRDFSNGYLIGEILHKYRLQTDFDMFNNDNNKSSKANNFSRLKPSLQMIGMSIDETTAQELMERKPAVASHLIYELYVALEQKKKGVFGGSVADMIPNAPSTRLRMKEQIQYCKKLHSGFDFEDIKPGQFSRYVQDEEQQFHFKLLETDAAQQNKPLSFKEKTKRRMRLILQNEIKKFEENKRKFALSASSLIFHLCSNFNLEESKSEAINVKDIDSKQPIEYIEQIRHRLKEESFTQKQREKRAVLFLMEQSKARLAEQDEYMEESLVKRLTRQTKIEKHFVAQLLQVRAQKEVFVKNNLIRQQQFAEKREKEFQEALEREAALARQERLAHAAVIQSKLGICNKLSAERKQKRYFKHFSICKEILGQIVDLATKAGDYRLLTDSLIPEKQMKEWKEFLLCGLPLYENEEDKQIDPLELRKQDELNKLDFEEYKNMVGEWAWPEDAQLTEKPPTNRKIFDHMIVQMKNTVHPPPSFPHFIFKACLLGKSCSGKTTCLDKIAQAHGLYVLSTDNLVEEVINVYHSKYKDTDQQSSPPVKDDQDPTEEVTDTKLAKWPLLGEAANKVMTEGKAVPAELLVEIITETIRQLPANSGWILDGFPEDIVQAHLLEKALGGSVEDVGEVKPGVSAPALDLVLILDVSNECVASRAAKQTDEDDLAVISSSCAAFEETWPQVEEWFVGKQSMLVHVNAEVDEQELFKAVESIIQQVKKPIEGPLESSSNHERRPFFVDEPLPLGLAVAFCLHWDTVCELYANKVKAVLQKLRLQHTAFDQHYFNLRDEFKVYMNRPDPKKDLISHWQKDYNKSLHVMQDEAKLQQRLDDLLEELWHVSDKCREENEQKVAHVKENESLVDYTNDLLQHHSTLIQVEVERFQDTLGIFKTFYPSVCKQTIPGNDQKKRYQQKSCCSIQRQRTKKR